MMYMYQAISLPAEVVHTINCSDALLFLLLAYTRRVLKEKFFTYINRITHPMNVFHVTYYTMIISQEIIVLYHYFCCHVYDLQLLQ
jgi:hypothetical protein